MNATTPSRGRRPGVRRGRSGGFTLTEIMIALGVMVIGLGMAAGAFHAGIQNHMTTIDDIFGRLICENAVAIAKVRLRHTLNDGGSAWGTHNRINSGFGIVADADAQGRPLVLVTTDKRYPIPPEAIGGDPRMADRSRMGYLLIARRATGREDRNDYVFKVVPYALQHRGNWAATETITNAMVMDGPPSDPGNPASKPKYSRVMATNKMHLLPAGAKVISIAPDGELDQITVVKVLSRFAVQLDKYIPKGLRTLLVLVVRNAEGQSVSPDDPDPARRDRIELLTGYDIRTSLTPSKN
jgi:hypothetical protein